MCTGTDKNEDTNDEMDENRRKLKEYKEALDRIEKGFGPVGSEYLNDDSIPIKPPPKDD